MKSKFGNQTLCLLLVAFGAALVAQAENWAQFRGPDGQGISREKKLPVVWGEGTNIAWKTEVPGTGWSSPIVWGNRVMLTTATDNGETCRVLSFDAKIGKVVWSVEVLKQQPGHKQARNTYATPTPCTDGRRVYAVFGDGSFAAVDFSGKKVWENREHPFYGEHGLATSPLLYEGLVIMARDGSNGGEDKKLGWQKPWDQAYVLALDARTGQERWRGKRGLSRISHGAPCVWKAPDGQVQIVSEAGDVLQGFDPKTGSRLWTSEVIGEGKVPSVVVGDGLAFTSGGWGGKETIKAFRIGGAGELKEKNLVWEQKKGMPKVPSMLYLRPYLYAITDGGVVTCMQGDSGELIYQERVGGNFSASPVAIDGNLYFLGDNGETTVVQAGPSFKVLSRNSLGEKVQASMAVSGGKLFIRTEKHLFCVSR